MTTLTRRLTSCTPIHIALAALLVLPLSGCGYNQLVSMREAIDAAWAQVENQLQRRNDLITNPSRSNRKREGDSTRAGEAIGAKMDEQIDAANQESNALAAAGDREAYPQLAGRRSSRGSDELRGDREP
jgi:LemA protein